MPKGGRSRRIRVIRAHGNLCWLCLEDIDLRLVAPHPNSFTVDHVVPKSEGGSGYVGNLRPAHRKCNENKANTIPWEHTVNGRRLLIRNNEYYTVRMRKNAS